MAVRNAFVLVGDRERFFRIEAKTGKITWKVPLERFTVVRLVGEAVLVAGETWGEVRALSAESGKTLYKIVARELRLWRDRWLLLEPGSVAVASATTGEILERRGPLPHLLKDGQVRIEGDVMLYEAEGDVAVAYDLTRERLLWQRPLRQEIQERCGCEVTSVILKPIEPDRFLAKVQNFLVGGSLADGSLLWHVPARSGSTSGAPTAIEQGRIYAMVSVSQHDEAGRPLANPPAAYRLVCIEASTGKTVYDVERPERTAMDVPSVPVVHGGYIAFGVTFTRQSLLTLHRLEDGELVWSYRHKTRVTPRAMDDERLYAVADGNLLIFEGSA
jgi:outer membrane protein assembly factor BamB